VGLGHNVEATGAVAALGAWRGHLAGSAGSPEQSFLVSASAYGAAGAEVTDLGGNGLVRGLDGERAYHVSGRARLGDFTLVANVNHREKDIPTGAFGTVVGAAGTQVLDERAFAELRYDHDFSALGVSARVYYDASRYRGLWVYEVGSDEPVTDAGRADWMGAEARARLALSGSNHLTVGVEGQLQLRVEQEVFGFARDAPLQTRTRSILSAYALDEWKLHPRLTVSAGLRVDRYSDLEAVPLSPRLAVIARPYDGGLTKLVAGSAFRAPNVYELYYEDFGQTQKPALRLDPETITTLELEHSHNLTEELRLTFAGYWNRISSLVVLQSEDAAQPNCGTVDERVQCDIFRNAPELVQAYGGEVALRWQPGRFALVDLSYSYVGLMTEAEDLRATVPTHLVAARLMLPLGESGVRLATQAVYQSARGQTELSPGLGDALLVNVGLSGDLGWLRYFAGVNNLMDTRYALPASQESGLAPIPQYGRTFLVQLTVSY
jgi:outer membrane receptor for ferrienterochelin and colicin